MERYVSDLFVCTYIRRWMEIKFVEMTKNVRIAFVVTHLFLKETFFRYMNITSLTGYSFLLAIPGGFGGFLLLLHYSPLSFWMRFSSMFAPTWYECIIVLMNLSTESTISRMHLPPTCHVYYFIHPRNYFLSLSLTAVSR